MFGGWRLAGRTTTPVALRVGLVALAFGVASPGAAQLLPARAVPPPFTPTFELFPATSAAMGGVRYAIDDPAHDPLVNPALGARLSGARLFTAPTEYSISEETGAGRTLPFGALASAGRWFGGVGLGLQQVDPRGSVRDPAGNQYLFALVGRRLPRAMSVGLSVQSSRLGGMDGIADLYPSSVALEQSGRASDVRLGVLKEWSGERALEVMGVRSNRRYHHEVRFRELFWEPGGQQPAQRILIEDGDERARTWGAHAAYRHPLAPTGWRLGWSATYNATEHGATPRYETIVTPSDAGRTKAFDLGVGVVKNVDASTFALDLAYQPARSRT